MASNTLFPPVVNNIEPAFVVHPAEITNGGNIAPNQQDRLRIYFKFSALNSDLDKSNISVHATIHLKTGLSVVNVIDGGSNDGTILNTLRLRATQIILNLKPERVANTDYYYIELKNEDVDLQTTSDNISDIYYGFRPGDFYKVQIRLSTQTCTGDDAIDQQAWLYRNADNFSEWSEVIYSKAISDYNIEHYDEYEQIEPYDQIPVASEAFKDKTIEYTGTTLGNYRKGYYYTCIEDDSTDPKTYSWEHVPREISYPQTFQGKITFIKDVSNEHYSSCLLKIYESNLNQDKVKLIEEVTLYPNEIDYNNYNYTIKYNFDIEKIYYAEFSFVTDNKFQSEVIKYWFKYRFNTAQICNYKLVTVNDSNHLPLIKKIRNGISYYASLGEENDEACIGLKIEYDPYFQQFAWSNINLRILRTSEESNFTIWEVVKYINLKFDPAPQDADDLIEYLNKMDMFYDYTIESNIFYKYAIQSYMPDQDKWTHIKEIENPIQRDFEYSYLLGKDQRQLKIKFNDSINSFIPQVYDAKLEPIGSQFPYIYRNSKANYRIFSISGTISFEMDDNETFLPNGELDIYESENVKNLHKEDWIYGKYNYGYERKFRQKVLDFLKDGEYKIYKSATEGDIVVRLKDINCTPNQQLGRLIYNFSANAEESDNYTLDNIKKYGILYPGTYVTNWSKIDPIPIPSDPTESENLPHSHGSLTTVTTPHMRITL